MYEHPKDLRRVHQKFAAKDADEYHKMLVILLHELFPQAPNLGESTSTCSF